MEVLLYATPKGSLFHGSWLTVASSQNKTHSMFPVSASGRSNALDFRVNVETEDLPELFLMRICLPEMRHTEPLIRLLLARLDIGVFCSRWRWSHGRVFDQTSCLASPSAAY